MLVIKRANLANAFICRASCKPKWLADISVPVSTDTSPQNKQLNKKVGFLRPEGNAAISFPVKKQTAVFRSSPEGAGSESL
jgi:hypothetical protein